MLAWLTNACGDGRLRAGLPRVGRGDGASRRSQLSATAGVAAIFLSFTVPAATAAEEPAWLSYAAPSNVVSPAPMPRDKSKMAAAKGHHDDGPDTEHIFGITMGSDIGEKGEFELELETFGGLGKRAGRYLTTATHTHFKYTVTDNLRVAPGFTLGFHDIGGVPDLINRTAFGIHDASVEIRYKLLDRHVAPFGWTLNFEPIASRIDDVSGERIEGYSVVLSSLMDKELIPNRLYGALNVGYFAGTSRLSPGNVWTHDSDLAVGAGLSYQFIPGLLFGVETRYLQAFSGLGLDQRKGQALFVGPTFAVSLTKEIGLSGAWNFQAAGKALDVPHPLDLTNFERHQGLLRLTAHF